MWLNKLIIVMLCALPLNALALSNDANEKIHIDSTSFNYNYKTGVDVYEGNVKVDQGTTHITADKLITKKDQFHKIREAIAYGYQKLAHYWTVPEEGEAELHTEAKIIKFYPNEDKVIFEKNVIATQGENKFQGELVLYNRKDKIISVPPSLNARAVLVYKPE